ncbi:zinc finger protein 277-like [Lingula anatina]|uniref:Zinc finger protein 277-like n=1 Tax=Lingula anatina TaxID=7574 RepID=A0A1S3JG88_LINAN|nr:zinc finger protein 277-like [Lingula anatina]|eukprot:XP_013409412.1 zinc finger protein 277-like [Lingula anatina]
MQDMYDFRFQELGKNWENIQSEHDVAIEDDETDNEEEWTSWTDDTGARAVCLFCCHGDTDMDRLLEHMKVVHRFDLKTVRQAKRLNFYQQVKLINYIRRQMHQNCCILCSEKFEAREDLIGHYTHSGHVTQFPESSDWDQPEYFFPTFEKTTYFVGWRMTERMMGMIDGMMG